MNLFKKQPHIVVVGAGYAGLPLSFKLGAHASDKLRVTLINPEPRQELTCDLYRTLRNGKTYSFAFGQKLARKKVQFIEGTLQEIDTNAQKLRLRSHIKREVHYDRLVLATGLQSVTPNVDGLDELLEKDRESLKKRIFSFKKINHAQALKMALVREGWSPDNHDLKKDLFVVIIGAGSTGLEVAGELAELRGKNRRCRIVLVDNKNEMLPDFSPFASRLIKKKLRKLGIETVLGSSVAQMNNSEIHLSNRQVIPWDLCVLCAGEHQLPQWATQIAQESGDENKEQLFVNENFRLNNFETIYSIGDLAHLKTPHNFLSPGAKTLPMRAQFAAQSGYHLADVIKEDVLENSSLLPNFRPRDLGYLVSLGPREGIGRIGPAPASTLGRLTSPFITGAKVDSLKRAVRLRYLLGLKSYKFFI